MKLSEMKMPMLTKAAKDLNDVLKLNPPLPTKPGTKRTALEKEYRDVTESDLLRDSDYPKLQEDTLQVLVAFGVKVPGMDDGSDDDGGDDKGKTPPKKKATAKKKAAAGKKNAGEKKEKKPGVIATILDMITAKPMTEDQIVAALVKKFPDRLEESMRKTVKVQLPNRMSKEKGVNIVKDDKGKFSVQAGKRK